MCVWHSGDMPRSTKVVFNGALQKRQAKLRALIAPVAGEVDTDEFAAVQESVDFVRADLPAAAQVGLLDAAHGRDDFRADGPGHLHDHRADPAGAAVDEHRLARLQVGTAEQAQVGRDADQRPGHRQLVLDPGRRGIEPVLVDGRQLREGALPAQ